MMEWKRNFEKIILDRGKEYFESGLVEDMETDTDEITAIVIGSDEYEVTIELDNNEVGEMYCTCPYADEGYYCKHMAAVMYAYEAAPETKHLSNNRHKPNAEELVSNADEKTIREFLINALKKDKKLLDSFALTVSSSSDDIDISSYKQRINILINRHTDRYGFVDYYAADDFIDDAVDFINNEINGLIDKGYTTAAFEVSCCLFKKVSDVDMDDSDGGLSYFGSEMLDTWLNILEYADENEKREMFNLFLSHLSNWVIDYMEDYVENILFDTFREPEYLDCKLKFVDDRISVSDDWHKKHWIICRVHLMEQMNFTENEFLAYCKEYYDERSVREVLVNYYLNRERKEEAIAILEDSLANYTTNPMTAGELHCQLKELYKDIGNEEKYREHLWVLVTGHCTLDHFCEMKTLYPADEWQSVRERVFQANTSYTLMQLYNEEKLYDRLMAELEREGTTSYTKEYENLLNKLYPDRMLKLYADYLNREARTTAKRTTYAYWAGELKNMLTIKGGKKVVAEIIADWRVRYRNRPAMIQELKSVNI